ncbi:nucleoside hydrolase [Lichenihabitans sp. Uapishka_5]|uniref:nucleoside hydrolase n=1 Tax=Lichenihabitans sp. Uapishka_5 TaxID=3037302 RepID=UPI0029E7D049|nr:nucleoside hydrolase [Lichenihabitans sp. Uapishka_5]MDX7953177.1 nucleoside hydrolase [Lichenihabitans sp. Uapishka_5]
MPRLSTLTLLAAALLGASAVTARAADTRYVVMDNDFAGPGGTDMQAVLPLLAAPDTAVLGLTVVTGDGWENEESAHLRRLLEIAGRTDVPVADGAAYPLINSVARMKLWEQAYGTIPWKGAWGALGSIDKASPTQPPVPALAEGEPQLKPTGETAAALLIRAVHAHPHQVTVIAAGPLTNLALAIRMDPGFAADAKQLVFMGALIDTNMMAVTDNADYASDFNFIFDPEAAHITLTAPWPKITAIGNVSNGVVMTRALMDRIATAKTPLTDYLSKNFIELPLWDEMAGAVALDPTLITKSVEALMDVDLMPGMNYGHAHIWKAELAPKGMDLRPVTVVQDIDAPRFVDNFVKAAQGVGAKP